MLLSTLLVPCLSSSRTVLQIDPVVGEEWQLDEHFVVRLADLELQPRHCLHEFLEGLFTDLPAVSHSVEGEHAPGR